MLNVYYEPTNLHACKKKKKTHKHLNVHVQLLSAALYHMLVLVVTVGPTPPLLLRRVGN